MAVETTVVFASSTAPDEDKLTRLLEDELDADIIDIETEEV